MKIIIDTDSSYAPCSYLICELDESGDWNTRDESRTFLVSSDWEYPSIAAMFGWSHPDIVSGETDGTVDGPTASVGDMIESAGDFLSSIAGDIEHAVDDPGYIS